MAHVQDFVDRFRAKASKARQVQSRLNWLARLPAIIEAQDEESFAWQFEVPRKLPRPLVALDQLAGGYGSRRVFEGLGLSIAPGDRIGILGRNGAGKSTLMKTIAGTLPPLAGERVASPDLEAGFFAQLEVEQLDAAASAIEELGRRGGPAIAAWPPQRKRDHLGRFGFRGERVFEPVDRFSGGERARLTLAVIVAREPNLLLLDEPTNHLDFEMRSALMLALQDYAGAVLIVSHDRCCCAVFATTSSSWSTGPCAPSTATSRTTRRGSPGARPPAARNRPSHPPRSNRRQPPRHARTGAMPAGAMPAGARPRHATACRRSARNCARSKRNSRRSPRSVTISRARLRIPPSSGVPPSSARSPPASPHSRIAGSRWAKPSMPRSVRKPGTRKLITRALLGALHAVWVGVGAWNTWKPMPEGVVVSGAWMPLHEGDVQFLRDVTAADGYGHPIIDQQIFDAAFRLIADAQRLIVLDVFLFNAHQGALIDAPVHRPLAAELVRLLVDKRRADPGIRILLVTDPINDVYGGEPSPELATLRAAGVEVVITDLDRLRDSNPRSAIWRIALRWWAWADRATGQIRSMRVVNAVSLGVWARLVNFKANHRKVIIADGPDGALHGS